MRHYLLIFILLLGLCSSALSANPADPQTESFLSDFLVGSYQVIGKYPDSDLTYFGKVKIEKAENGLKITRSSGVNKSSSKENLKPPPLIGFKC